MFLRINIKSKEIRYLNIQEQRVENLLFLTDSSLRDKARVSGTNLIFATPLI